jgi:hypothetical protein
MFIGNTSTGSLERTYKAEHSDKSSDKSRKRSFPLAADSSKREPLSRLLAGQ